MAKREAPVSLKTLHNLQSKINKKLNSENNELASLLAQMEKIPGSKIKVAVDESNQLIGIFFQDERMASIFEKKSGSHYFLMPRIGKTDGCHCF